MLKKYTIGLIAGTVLIGGVIITAPEGYEPLVFQDREVSILYTDENSGEDLIIKSDRANYGGSDTVWFSVENKDVAQNVALAGLFNDPSITYTIKEIKLQQEFEEVSHICEGKTSEPTIENKSGCSVPVTEVRKIVKKDVAEELPTIKNLTGFAVNEKAPQDYQDKGKYQTFIKAGETKHFMMHITAPIKLDTTPDVKEFYIEAVGDEGAYGSLDPWYNSSWNYRVPITVDADQVASDLTDFPVYVDLSTLPAGFHTNVKSDGGDIRVTTSDGSTEVPREVVWYTAASDTGELHFKGTLASTTDTTFYIYYGNAAASEPAIDSTYGAENVWTEFAAVYHMHDASGTIVDSTANDVDLSTITGTPVYQQPGQMGYGIYFDGTEYASGPVSETAHPFSLSGWGNKFDETNIQSIISIGNSSIDTSRTMVNFNASAKISAQSQTSSVNFPAAVSVDSYASSTYYLAHGVFSANNARGAYVNGGGLGINLTTATPSGYNQTRVGARVGVSVIVPFVGTIDEARVAKGTLVAGWVAAEYINQATPGTFYTVGTEEQQTSAKFEIENGTVEIKSGNVIFN